MSSEIEGWSLRPHILPYVRGFHLLLLFPFFLLGGEIRKDLFPSFRAHKLERVFRKYQDGMARGVNNRKRNEQHASAARTSHPRCARRTVRRSSTECSRSSRRRRCPALCASPRCRSSSTSRPPHAPGSRTPLIWRKLSTSMAENRLPHFAVHSSLPVGPGQRLTARH